MKTLEIIKNKIIDLNKMDHALKRWRLKEDKIVFTNGCFDLLHRGHIDYLSKAADLGNRLVVGLNSDQSVKRLNKGDNRPLQDEYSRALILAGLHFVSTVIIFDEDTPLKLINFIRPDVLVKGSDYEIHEIVGHKEVKAYGGLVKSIDFLAGFSTTSIISKMK